MTTETKGGHCHCLAALLAVFTRCGSDPSLWKTVGHVGFGQGVVKDSGLILERWLSGTRAVG